jgi:hypothetical protein
MSQQTNAGFNAPGFPVCSGEPPCTSPCAAPTVSDSGQLFRSCVSGEAMTDLWSRAVGVGHMLFASVEIDPRAGPTRPAEPPWFDPYSVAHGVGHRADVAAAV